MRLRLGLLAAGLAVAALGTAVLGPLAARAADEASARIEYDPPRLSVVAAEMALGELLRLIGAKVGFTVAEGPAASRRVTVTIAGASVDDALRQLLRAENHTILYRKGGEAEVIVDRIVLLGAPAEGGVVADAGLRSGREAPASAPDRPTSVPAPAAAAPSAPGTVPVAVRPGEGATAEEQPILVGDMLRSHALGGVPPPPPAGAVAEPSAPPGLEESLAITTQRAQQGLTSLVEGLERATRSLQPPPPGPAPGR